jgi:hypothetical protein
VSDRTWDVDGKASEALRYVVEAFGESICFEVDRLRSTLSDLLPEGTSVREMSLLVAAARAGVPSELKSQLLAGMSPDGAVQLVAQRLGEAQPFDHEGCLWVTRQFASTLTDYPVPAPVEHPVQSPIGETGGRSAPPEWSVAPDGEQTIFPSRPAAETMHGDAQTLSGHADPRIAALDLVRRPLTLWILSAAAAASAIAQPFTSLTVFSALTGIAFGMLSIAAFIGASWARVPTSLRRKDTRDLFIVGIGSSLAALGWFAQSISNSTQSLTWLLDAGIISEVVGSTLLGLVVISFAVSYRHYRGGRMNRSPSAVLVAVGVGAILWWAPDVYGLTWFTFSQGTVKVLYGAVEGGGALLVGVALLVAAAMSLGPPASLIAAGLGAALIGVTQVREFYTQTSNNGAYYAIGFGLICVSIVILAVRTGGQPTSIVATTGSSGMSPPVEGQQRSRRDAAVLVAKRTVLFGAAITLAGVIILIVTYKLTSTRYFYFGPIVVGLLVMYRGVRAWLALSRQTSTGSTAAPASPTSGPTAATGRTNPPAVPNSVTSAPTGPRTGVTSGEPMVAPPPATSVTFCVDCGSKRGDGARFCASCGRPFESVPG